MFVAILPIVIGFFLDLAFGDPQTKYHPICLIGSLITKTEKAILSLAYFKCDDEKTRNKRLIFGGFLLALIVISISFFVPFAIIFAAKKISIWLGVAVEGVMCYFILAQKSLKEQSMAVYDELENNNIDGARKRLSYIVGRDTKDLDEEQIAKAAVETVAENTADGVIAPMIYIFFGGASLGFLFKAVNTLDSMVGYKNDKYLYFGKASARLDDIFGFIPARVSAILIILASALLDLDYKNAWTIFLRDRKNHPSPNSAQSEAACAGALGIMLGGGSFYGGKFCEKPTIGDSYNEITSYDIVLANKLLYVSSGIFMYIGVFVKLVANFTI
ncbi:MAG: adenosylcobinamide-phosphate synthase CbiB [Oscillospiraceae bacterium]